MLILKRKAVAERRPPPIYDFITAIRDCARNRRDPVLSTHANPKAGRAAGVRPPRNGHFYPLLAGLTALLGKTELAMAGKNNSSPREGLTFDDVLIKPGLSEILPADVDIRSHITRSIPVNIPIIASAMDTVTEAQMAIAMAQAGGIGVLHRNMEPDVQAAQVRQVKKFESGMVVNPLTFEPDA